MMPLFHSASSPARRSWKRFGSKSKILSKQFSRYGILFVISAPSGAGKTTLVDALRQTPNFVYSVSCTTRAPRGGEIEGRSEEHTSELQSHSEIVCRLLLEKKTKRSIRSVTAKTWSDWR